MSKLFRYLLFGFLTLLYIGCDSKQEEPKIGYPLGYFEVTGNVSSIIYKGIDTYDFKEQKWIQEHSESSGFYEPYSIEFGQEGYQTKWIGKGKNNEGVIFLLTSDNGDLNEYKNNANIPLPIFFPQLNSGKYEYYNVSGNNWQIMEFEDSGMFDAWTRRKNDEGTMIIHNRQSDLHIDSFLERIVVLDEVFAKSKISPSFDHYFQYNENGILEKIGYPGGEVVTFDKQGRIIQRLNPRNYDNESYEIQDPSFHVRKYNFVAGKEYREEYRFTLDASGNWLIKIVDIFINGDIIYSKRIVREVYYFD